MCRRGRLQQVGCQFSCGKPDVEDSASSANLVSSVPRPEHWTAGEYALLNRPNKEVTITRKAHRKRREKTTTELATNRSRTQVESKRTTPPVRV
jgi:hypothetical protein